MRKSRFSEEQTLANRLRTGVRIHSAHANASVGQWRALRASDSCHGAP